jgi:hypothetical protein
MNIYVTNVPGPLVPLYFAGAAIIELFPIVPILGNVSIGVGALSYAGQFNLITVADRDLCPDVDTFVSGLERSVARLVSAHQARPVIASTAAVDSDSMRARSSTAAAR